jgi:RNA polymerase sigma-70 factor (ECF subfamily)
VEIVDAYYRAYSAHLYRLILSITGCRADADDALQNVFVRIARMGEAAARLDSAAPYLFQMARNEALRLLEKRRRPPAPEYVRPAEGTGGAEEINRALAELPREQREVVALHVYSGLTFREVAEMLGENPDTVASRYRYGIEKLRERLRSYADGRSA